MSKNIILITGASSAIGQEVIKKFQNNKNILLATYNKNNFKIKKDSKKKIIKFKLDLSNEKKVVEFVKNLSRKNLIPNKIIHIASSSLKMSSFTDLNWADYEKNFNIQIKSFFIILKYVLPIMKKNNYGKILAILSSVTISQPPGFMSPYITSKYALLGLLKSLAAEYSKYKICVNSISPGMMKTNFINKIPKKILEINNQKVPFGRSVEINDIIPVLEFLMSDKSSFITGTNIPITGGLNL
jgi:3-oxoacyl-[acyl-carrier protein] reductase